MTKNLISQAGYSERTVVMTASEESCIERGCIDLAD
jgi:hypothetical protein